MFNIIKIYAKFCNQPVSRPLKFQGEEVIEGKQHYYYSIQPTPFYNIPPEHASCALITNPEVQNQDQDDASSRAKQLHNARLIDV